MATASILELTDENICKMCENALGKYTCPKCNILYCSLACYQNESHLECSEQFYRDCVMDNLPPGANNESNAKMLEILARMHEENEAAQEKEQLDSDDESIDDYLDLADRLAGIDLDDTEKVWEHLTDREKKDFEKFVCSEDVVKLVKAWKPWWMYHCKNKVLDIEEFEKIKKDCPKIKEGVANFYDISKKPPSDSIQYNLINILASYAFTLRYFNGEYQDFVPEAVACISKISLNLNKNVNYNTFDDAIESVELQCSILDWLYPDGENIKLMKEDVRSIMQGPHSTERKFYITCCLSDLFELFGKALRVNSCKDKKGQFSKAFPQLRFPESELEDKASIKRSIKKFEFLLSYVKDVLNILDKLQWLACVCITGATRTYPTATLEVILDLPPLHIVVERVANMAIYRLTRAGTSPHF
ncbi:hypothetical protein Trydic_g23173 [Trypoxylus dichotomus]